MSIKAERMLVWIKLVWFKRVCIKRVCIKRVCIKRVCINDPPGHVKSHTSTAPRR
jgi:hypothetical protein